jgi:hypothetical protein
LFYGWYDAPNKQLRLSAFPPDAPVRPSVEISSVEAAQALAERKRADIYWWPPLPVEGL